MQATEVVSSPDQVKPSFTINSVKEQLTGYMKLSNATISFIYYIRMAGYAGRECGHVLF